MTGVRSPSKHSTIAQLASIRESNYIGAAKEYSAEEVDDDYFRKIQRKADRIDFSSAPDARPKKRPKAKPRRYPGILISPLDRPAYLCDSIDSSLPFVLALSFYVLLVLSLIVR